MENGSNVKPLERKALPIIGIVFGALALALSWIPLVNNVAAIFAGIGIVLGIISILVNLKHKKTLTWVALGLSIASFAIVMVTQNSFSKALDNESAKIDKDFSDDDTDTSNNKSSSEKSSKEEKTYKIGDTVKYNDIEFKVNSFNFKDDDPDTTTLDAGNQFAVANITVTNKSDDTISYSPNDFKLDNEGNLTDFDEIDTDNNTTFDYGDLKPGASVTGDLIGQGNAQQKLKLNYNGDMFTTDEQFSVTLN